MPATRTKHGASDLLKLFAGIAFGVLLEIATIRQLNAYQYGQFMLMVLDVPLCIGVAWSCIIYAVMEFSDGSTLPYFTRPVLDGLLALNIHLAMDTIAIRLTLGLGAGLKNFNTSACLMPIFGRGSGWFPLFSRLAIG